MLHLAKLVKYEEDPDKLGWIKVEYKEQIRWARPCFAFGHFFIPSKEWIDKYINSLAVWVTTEQGGDDRENYLIWMGFTFLDDGVPAEALENYGYVRHQFTENWFTSVDDTPGDNKLIAKHRDNGISVTFDNSGFEVIDKHGNYIRSRANTGADGGIGIDVNGEVLIALKPFVDWAGRLLQALLNLKVLGNMGSPAPVFPSSVVELTQLQSELNAGIQPNGGYLSDRLRTE